MEEQTVCSLLIVGVMIGSLFADRSMLPHRAVIFFLSAFTRGVRDVALINKFIELTQRVEAVEEGDLPELRRACVRYLDRRWGRVLDGRVVIREHDVRIVRVRLQLFFRERLRIAPQMPIRHVAKFMPEGTALELWGVEGVDIDVDGSIRVGAHYAEYAHAGEIQRINIIVYVLIIFHWRSFFCC
jgi:hypothetical protein